MRSSKLIIAGLAILLAGCSQDEQKANNLLQRAEASFQQGEFSEAKLQIDSVKILYPKAFEARKAAIKLMQRVDLEEQQRTLVYLDSTLSVKQASLDSIKGQFVLEKDTAYQEIGNYFYPTQVVEKNVGRSFLRAQVSEQGEMSLTSIFCAGGKLHHTAVKVSNKDAFAQTPASTDSYETTDLGRSIEKADYKLGKDGGVIGFIIANREAKSLKLEFIGDRTYRTIMYANDIKAIAAVSDLARILASMEEIRKEQKEANLKIQFVTRKIEEAAAASNKK